MASQEAALIGNSTGSTHSHPFALATKLQHDMTAELEEQELAPLLADCQPFQRTIMAELIHAAASGAWLLALPTQSSYRLRNDEYELAVRKRLGMLPHNSLLCVVEQQGWIRLLAFEHGELVWLCEVREAHALIDGVGVIARGEWEVVAVKGLQCIACERGGEGSGGSAAAARH